MCVCACVHRRMRRRSVTCPAGRHMSGRVPRAAQEGVDRGGRQREDVRRVGRRVVAQQGACRGTVATSRGVVVLRSSQAVRLAVPLSAAALVAGRGRSRRSSGPVPDGRLGRARCCHCGVPVMRTYITAADAPRYRLCTCRTTSRSSSIAPRAAWTRHARWCSLLVRRGSSFHSPAASPAYIALRGLHCKLGRVSSVGTSAMAVFSCNTASGAALDGIRPQADRWR